MQWFLPDEIAVTLDMREGVSFAGVRHFRDDVISLPSEFCSACHSPLPRLQSEGVKAVNLAGRVDDKLASSSHQVERVHGRVAKLALGPTV